VTGSGYVVLPPEVHSTVSLGAAETTGRLRITPLRADGSLGDPETVEVPGGTSATVQLDAEVVAVRVDRPSGGPIGASVVSWASDPRGSLISVLGIDLVAGRPPPSLARREGALGSR
jgi:hypothetical protein